MGPAQKKYKAILEAEAAKKKAAAKKPAPKPEAKPKGIRKILGGRQAQLDAQERRAGSGGGGHKKK